MDRIKFLNQLATSTCRYNLGAGVPPLEDYPVLNEIECYETFIKAYPNAPIKQYHQTDGFLGELGSHVFKEDGFSNAQGSNVVITNGVQEAITLACWLFKNNTIACTDPCYPGLSDLVGLMGKTPLFLPETNWISSLEKLPKGSLFYLSADFANPTGKRITLDERKQVLAIAEKNDFYIFEDATYRPFFLDHSLPSLVSLAPERVFHSISFSKILSPGLRIAMTHVPSAFRNAFLSLKANVSLNSSGFTQAIVGGWLLKNEFSLSKHLDAFKNLMRNKQEFLLTQHVAYEGGFFVEMTLQHPSIDLAWCTELLAKEDVAACPMSMFSDNLTHHNKLRLAIAKISLENLKVGYMKIHNFAGS